MCTLYNVQCTLTLYTVYYSRSKVTPLYLVLSRANTSPSSRPLQLLAHLDNPTLSRIQRTRTSHTLSDTLTYSHTQNPHNVRMHTRTNTFAYTHVHPYTRIPVHSHIRTLSYLHTRIVAHSYLLIGTHAY